MPTSGTNSPKIFWLHQGKTLASLKIEELRTDKVVWDTVNWIEPDDLFLSEFFFINQSEKAIPGALMPDEVQPITFSGERITPLIPLNPILLEYFSPDELIDRIKLQPLNGEYGPSVRVILDLPLAGIGNRNVSTNYRLHKNYPLKPENAFSEVPMLEVWPNLKAEGWKEYYALYYDAELGSGTFQIHFPETVKASSFQDDRKGQYQYDRFDAFPSFIECKSASKKSLGAYLTTSTVTDCS